MPITTIVEQDSCTVTIGTPIALATTPQAMMLLPIMLVQATLTEAIEAIADQAATITTRVMEEE